MYRNALLYSITSGVEAEQVFFVEKLNAVGLKQIIDGYFQAKTPRRKVGEGCI